MAQTNNHELVLSENQVKTSDESITEMLIAREGYLIQLQAAKAVIKFPELKFLSKTTNYPETCGFNLCCDSSPRCTFN